MSEPKLLNNRYQIEAILGRGGMAVVYRARDLMLERVVAIKVLKEEYSSDPAFRERFRQEATAAANLSHPNIVTVHDYGFDDGQLFIVMEHVPGTDLNAIIKEYGRLGVEEGIDLVIKACKGLGYAHRAELVHCDVKPHNFLVTEDRQLKITDFGIARAIASINPDETSRVVWGSPQYFSPEQATGGPPSRASDVYSLGVVMYLMFTGQLPFIGKTSTELARMHRTGTPIPPRELNPFLPEDLEAVILKVLSKEPSARYRTADQLGRVLQTILARLNNPPASPTEETQPPPSQTGRRSHRNQATQPKPVANSQPGSATGPNANTIQFENVDWAAVLLSLVAFSMVAGLLPLAVWVYTAFFPPLLP